jgi:hypothetical protein
VCSAHAKTIARASPNVVFTNLYPTGAMSAGRMHRQSATLTSGNSGMGWISAALGLCMPETPETPETLEPSAFLAFLTFLPFQVFLLSLTFLVYLAFQG